MIFEKAKKRYSHTPYPFRGGIFHGAFHSFSALHNHFSCYFSSFYCFLQIKIAEVLFYENSRYEQPKISCSVPSDDF